MPPFSPGIDENSTLFLGYVAVAIWRFDGHHQQPLIDSFTFSRCLWMTTELQSEILQAHGSGPGHTIINGQWLVPVAGLFIDWMANLTPFEGCTLTLACFTFDHPGFLTAPLVVGWCWIGWKLTLDENLNMPVARPKLESFDTVPKWREAPVFRHDYVEFKPCQAVQLCPTPQLSHSFWCF